MSGLGARVVVDLCTAAAANSRFTSGSGRRTASSSATSATATASLGRAGLMKGSVTHGDVAIQLWCGVRREGEGEKKKGWIQR